MVDKTNNKSENFDIMPPHLVVRAMRDSGYKNAAYAIAELVDNAVQAGASEVEILCEEHQEHIAKRSRVRVHRLAIVDNGCGMSPDVLRAALQYGNGTRLEDRTGIGRFGMGLPNSSLSQAQRLDVYSWTNGIASAIHSHLDVRSILDGTMRQVPQPELRPVGEEWTKLSKTASRSKSGTIVVWSRIDRCTWKSALAIFNNSEFSIGRIYRRMLGDGTLNIRMASFMKDEVSTRIDTLVKPNDPLYLLSRTSTPAPYDTTPMFLEAGSPVSFECRDDDGKKHVVQVRASMARPEARQRDQAGSLAHGKHAAKNIGVSIVRANRELELQLEWCIGYDPVERWWGVEVEFPPALDEVFGVTNNKQSATALANFAKQSLAEIAEHEGYKSEQELMESWEENQDNRLILARVKAHVEGVLRHLRSLLKVQKEGTRQRRNTDDPDSAEQIGTKASRQRRHEGHEGASDRDESKPSQDRIQDIRESLLDNGVPELEAESRAAKIVSDGLKYEFIRADLASSEFFSVRRKGGALLIVLNTSHPAYDRLVTVLEHGDDTRSLETLQARLQRSFEALKLLLEAWARYEDECSDGQRRDYAQEARQDWGRVARDFFRES